jgi:ribonuclease P protein component
MLKKTNRLTRTKDIDRVFKTGKSFFGKNIGIKTTANDLGVNRITVVVSGKVSKKAVIRNKIKRRIRYIMQQELDKLLIGQDIIFLTLPSVAKAEFEQIKNEVLFGLKKLKLYK